MHDDAWTRVRWGVHCPQCVFPPGLLYSFNLSYLHSLCRRHHWLNIEEQIKRPCLRENCVLLLMVNTKLESIAVSLFVDWLSLSNIQIAIWWDEQACPYKANVGEGGKGGKSKADSCRMRVGGEWCISADKCAQYNINMDTNTNTDTNANTNTNTKFSLLNLYTCTQHMDDRKDARQSCRASENGCTKSNG